MLLPTCAGRFLLRSGDRRRHFADKRAMGLRKCGTNLDHWRARTGWHAQACYGCSSHGGASPKEGYAGVLLPRENAAEAALIGGIEVYGLGRLNELVPNPPAGTTLRNDAAGESAGTVSLSHLLYDRSMNASQSQEGSHQGRQLEDYWDVIGQQHIKRALTIAAAGMHNILLIGPRYR